MKFIELATFDLARNTGWCHGDAHDDVPEFGSMRFGSEGCSHQAVFGHALDWFADLWSWLRPGRIIYEAPLVWRRGKSRAGNDEIAYGLPAVLMASAHRVGIYDIRKAETRDVRLHFIDSNPKRDVAKAATMRQCRTLGWKVKDDNQADACALWSYGCGLRKAEAALRPTPLFGGR